MSNAKVIIPWSGGFDSTYLILDSVIKGHDVNAPYFKIKNNPNQVKSELIAIKKILNHNYFKNVNHYIASEYELLYFGNIITLRQPLVWLLNLIQLVDDEVKYVKIAYVMNDCAISYLNDIKNIWNTYSKYLNIKLPELQFPIIKHNKKDIIKYIKQNFYDIYKNISFCEDPIKNKPCKECGSCKVILNVYPEYFKNKKN